MKNLVIYRGPLERARLNFIFETIQQKYGSFEFIWISPLSLTDERRIKAKEFCSGFNISNFHITEHSKWAFPKTILYIHKTVSNNRLHFLGLIGFSSIEYSLGLKANYTAWYINGIPEERLMHNSNWLLNKTVQFEWLLKKLFINKINIIVTVSKRMSAIVEHNVGKIKLFHAPTCADLSLFKVSDSVSKTIDFCYMGSGAPWQALHILKPIWDELYKLNPAFKFRVISRDPRCKILLKDIPLTNIEMVGHDDFVKVAKWLAECNYGFLIREDNIVNRVSFPTKLAEYLAAGCRVILSEIDWDLHDYVENNMVFEVGARENPKQIASKIFKVYQSKINQNASHSVNQADNLRLIQNLSKEYWVDKMIKAY